LDPDRPTVFKNDFFNVGAECDSFCGFGGLRVFGLGMLVDGVDKGVYNSGAASYGVVELSAWYVFVVFRILRGTELG